MGDYWGVCVPKGIESLNSLAPKGAIVSVPDVMNIAQLQYFRLTQGAFSRVPDFGPYRFTNQPTKGTPFYLLMYNRMNMDANIQRDIREGRAKKIWEDTMPPGDSACTLAYYPQ